MPEYTALAVLSVLGTVAVELLWLRTGVFRTGQYWISMGIVYFFHILVDGWLTKLSAPIVIYDGDQITGIRVPWDIPVEDYLFGFSMITLTILVWLRLGDRDAPAGVGDTSDTAGDTPRRTDRTTEETV
ncbi:MAG TPA: lycopene cyclase domain-containing protein [Ornithinibacter sp.]|nr:lycopene cyclase domain-containing protein [Ornithinibacter sp.]